MLDHQSDHQSEHTGPVPSPGATGQLRDGLRSSLDTYRRTLSEDLVAAEGASQRGDHDEAVATLMAHIERLEAMHRELSDVVAGAVAVREAEAVVEHAGPEASSEASCDPGAASTTEGPPAGRRRLRGAITTGTMLGLGLAMLSLLPGLAGLGEDVAKGILLAETDEEAADQTDSPLPPVLDPQTSTPPPPVTDPVRAPAHPPENELPRSRPTTATPDTQPSASAAGSVFAATTPSEPEPPPTGTEQAGLLGLPDLDLTDEESSLLPDDPGDDSTRQ